MEYMNEIVNKFNNDGIPMHPCTNGDLSDVRKLVGNRHLPVAYVEFLQMMGRGTEHVFLRGHSCFMDELLDLNAGAREILEENDFPQKLTDNDFVFWMSQGCMFCFFRLKEGENPPVYFYSETSSQTKFYKITDSFTEFLYRMYKKDKNIFIGQ